MALSSTNITTTLVRNTLSEAINTVFGLCTSSSINKWSRYKPTTGTRPGGTSGKFGLNLPTNWNIVPIVDTARLGDFRGYEHNKDIATPAVYCEDAEMNVPASITPNIHGNNCGGQFTMSCNTAHNDVRILPSELGIGSYYWGLKIGSYYRTFGVISDGTAIQFAFMLDLTDPSDPAFVDMPMMSPGTITWELFISSTAQTFWSTTQPSNYIVLPGGDGEVSGSKLIKSTGSFVLNNWIATDVQSLGWLYNEGGYSDYLSVYVVCSSGYWHLNQKPAEFGIKDASGVDIVAETGSYPSGAEARLYPLTTNASYNSIAGSFFFHDTAHSPAEVEVGQTGAPEPISVTVLDNGSNVNITMYEGIGTVMEDSSTIELVIVAEMSGYSEGQEFTCPYSITCNDNPAGLGFLTLKSSQNSPTLPEPIVVMDGYVAQVGDSIIVTIN